MKHFSAQDALPRHPLVFAWSHGVDEVGQQWSALVLLTGTDSIATMALPVIGRAATESTRIRAKNRLKACMFAE